MKENGKIFSCITSRKGQVVLLTFGLALEKNITPLKEIELNRNNWNILFPNGYVETPIGTVKQIKTADQILFAEPEISRVTSLILENGGSHVRLHGINTKAINSNYNINNILSTEELHFELYHLPKSGGRFIFK